MKFVSLRTMLASAAVGGLAFGAMAASASAGVEPVEGAAPLTIVKTVSGPAPAGTTFSATVQCDSDMIFDGADGTSTAVVEFDAAGQPTTPDIITFREDGSCSVTETVTGGASTTTYSCVGEVPVGDLEVPVNQESFAAVVPDIEICPAAGPQVSPIVVNILHEVQSATVTIANTFADPVPTPPITPAAQVIVQPTFTG